jgi:hypothetical protein
MPDNPFFDGRPRMSSPIKPKKKPVKALPYMALKTSWLATQKLITRTSRKTV